MLIERETHLRALADVARGCREGHGRVVILGGEAGIGKTSLLREFARTAAGECAVHWGGCEALFTPRPLGPLQDMARGLDPRLAALLAEGAAQDRVFPALLAALQAARRPHILVFEDVHWADNATLDLIKYLGRRIALLKAALVLSLRSDETGAGHPLSHVLGDLPAAAVTRIALAPLSPEGVASLAAETSHAPADLHRITAGNPFYVTELLAAGASPEDLPDSIRHAVWARISRLSAAERELLEVMSIVPSGVEPWLARRLMGEGWQAAADGCAGRGMLTRGADGLMRFRHELARLAALDRLNPEAQRTLHARALNAMSTGATDGASLPLSRLAHHAAGARDAKRVLDLAPRAAAEAAKLGSHREAARHLAMALDHASGAPPELAAELNESWAYEESLSLKIGGQVIASTEKAVALWRGLARKDKVARNLRRLSRLHWFRGEAAQAQRYAGEAIAALAGEPPGAELAMAYSNRAQLFMFDDRFKEAIAWSREAIALAGELGEIETRVHALNNLGGSLLMTGCSEGKACMEESLALALAHGFHEQVDRAYANYSEYAILGRDFALAERLLAEATAFSAKHDIFSGIHRHAGRQAHLRMEQGRFREAETIAAGVLGLDGLALVGKLLALTVLAKTRLRLGAAEGPGLMRQAMADALATQEQQSIVPARFGMVEAAWLQDDLAAARGELKAMAGLHLDGFPGWDMGAFAVWWRRCAMPRAFPRPQARLAAPYEAELNGDGETAAREWTRLGLPYEAALALMRVEGAGAAAALAKAVTLLESIEAKSAAALARRRAKELGVTAAMPKPRRGPYAAARGHPLGLTHKEVQVLGLIAQGLGNQDIARRMVRSLKTVEHHVSAVLGKLNAVSRMDVVLRLQSEPWLLPANQK